MNDIGLRVLIGIPFSMLFFVARGIEGHFGNWSEVTFILMFSAPTFILLVADRIKRRKTEQHK